MEKSQMKIDITIPFATNRLATIAYDVLRVDAEPKRSKVQKVLSVENNNLKANFSSETARQIRVALTCFFDNIALILQTMDFAGPPVSETYSYYEGN